jgi:hypothetical protein
MAFMGRLLKPDKTEITDKLHQEAEKVRASTRSGPPVRLPLAGQTCGRGHATVSLQNCHRWDSIRPNCHSQAEHWQLSLQGGAGLVIAAPAGLPEHSMSGRHARLDSKGISESTTLKGEAPCSTIRQRSVCLCCWEWHLKNQGSCLAGSRSAAQKLARVAHALPASPTRRCMPCATVSQARWVWSAISTRACTWLRCTRWTTEGNGAGRHIARRCSTCETVYHATCTAECCRHSSCSI